MTNARHFGDLISRKEVLLQSHKLILTGVHKKTPLTFGRFLPPTLVDFGSLRRKKETENQASGHLSATSPAPKHLLDPVLKKFQSFEMYPGIVSKSVPRCRLANVL